VIMNVPEVSVVMPVYNAAKYLRAAIESVLAQTYQNFEFIIVNDGSTDESHEIILSFNDQRIRLIDQKNTGVVNALNVGIKESRGKYVARMDADDFSLPTRLEKQVIYLDAHPDCVALGTAFLVVDEAGKPEKVKATFPEDALLRFEVLFQSPFGHGTVMLHRQVLDKVGGYSPAPDARHIEDYELWTRLAREGRLANLPQVLYEWRKNSEGVSAENFKVQLDRTYRLRFSQRHLFEENVPRLSELLDRARDFHEEKYEANGLIVTFNRRTSLAALCLVATKSIGILQRPRLAFRCLLASILIHPLGVVQLLRGRV
jgi:glycosyltransferase involved in cell wall biosynthesis